jgi:hypothetical protein
MYGFGSRRGDANFTRIWIAKNARMAGKACLAEVM